jgi:hypothetical protein
LYIAQVYGFLRSIAMPWVVSRYARPELNRIYLGKVIGDILEMKRDPDK